MTRTNFIFLLVVGVRGSKYGKIYGGIYNLCERDEYAFMTLREYSIITSKHVWSQTFSFFIILNIDVLDQMKEIYAHTFPMNGRRHEFFFFFFFEKRKHKIEND